MQVQNTPTPVPPERKGGIAMIELVPGARTGSAAVMVGAVGDPKIPPPLRANEPIISPRRRGELMNMQTNSKITKEQHGFAVTELLFVAVTVAASVLIGAMIEPKLPPLRGD